MEVYIDTLVEEIFGKPPKEKNEIQLSLVGEYSELDGLFEFLMDLFTRGCKLLYGDENGRVQLEKATDKELDLMKKYFASFGLELIIDRYDEQDTMVIDFDAINYKNITINDDTKLEELALPLKCGINIFVIKFKFLNIV